LTTPSGIRPSFMLEVASCSTIGATLRRDYYGLTENLNCRFFELSSSKTCSGHFCHHAISPRFAVSDWLSFVTDGFGPVPDAKSPYLKGPLSASQMAVYLLALHPIRTYCEQLLIVAVNKRRVDGSVGRCKCAPLLRTMCSDTEAIRAAG